ncbi:MAG: zinc ribbon domain-containing protein [Acidimicrobiales bacterium]
MAAEQYEQLLRMQELDTRLAQLEHAKVTHPLLAKIAETKAHASDVAASVQDEREERHRLERDQKRLDDEVAMLDAKRSDIESKLYDGSVTATKDLLAMQEESKHLGERKTSLEDSELEIMEQMESLQGVLDRAQAEVDADEHKIAEFENELAAAIAELDAEAHQVSAEREELVVSVRPELLAAYDKLRVAQSGIVVARLVGGSCQACHMALSAVTVDQIGKLPEDALVHCDECGAILVR